MLRSRLPQQQGRNGQPTAFFVRTYMVVAYVVSSSPDWTEEFMNRSPHWVVIPFAALFLDRCRDESFPIIFTKSIPSGPCSAPISAPPSTCRTPLQYALAAAKAVSPRGLSLDFSQGKGRYNFCGGSLNDDCVGDDDDNNHSDRPGVGSDGRIAGGGAGGVKGMKTFGGTSVRVRS